MEVGGDKNDEETYTPIAVRSFDDVLEKIGYWGWFLVILFTLNYLRGYIHGAQNNVPVFTMYIPKHR